MVPRGCDYTVGGPASETPSWSSVYTRKPERRSSNPLSSILRPLSISLFLGQVTPCSPCIKPLFNYPFLERYSPLPKPPARSFSRSQQPQIPPGLRPVEGQKGSRSQCDIDGDGGPFGYIFFCIVQTRRTHFPFKHFPFHPPHSGMCRLIPSPCL